VGGACTTANSCSTSFSGAGFVIASAANASATTLPTMGAGNASGTYYLRAVKTNSGACQAALSGSNTVNWAYQCNNPTTCSTGNLLSVTGSAGATAVAGNANGSAANSTAVTMTFDANGNAPFSFNHADVGQITLQATAGGGALLAALTGTSNAFVVKPAGFTLGHTLQQLCGGSCATGAITSPGNNPVPTRRRAAPSSRPVSLRPPSPRQRRRQCHAQLRQGEPRRGRGARICPWCCPRAATWR
jgi:hypothetical protein